MSYHSTGCRNELVEHVIAGDRAEIRNCSKFGVAINLRAIEDGGGSGHAAFSIPGLRRGRLIGFVGFRCDVTGFVEDDRRGLFIFADLASKFCPLPVCAPDRVGVALLFSGDPENESIDAVLRLLGQRIRRHEQWRLRVAMPRYGGFAGIGFDGSDDRWRHALIDCEFGSHDFVLETRTA